MKSVVLAGGYATRLWPITKNRAKPLLPVAGNPIIDHIIQPLEDIQEIDEIYVSTNERFRKDFQKYIDDSDYQKTTLAIEETTEEDEKFGTVGALEQLVTRESIDDDLLVIAGDNLFSFEIQDFINEFDSNDTPTIAAYDVESRQKAKQYGLVTVEDGEVVDFQEKPSDPKSTLVSIACYGFPADTLPLITEYLEGDNNPDAPGFFIEWLQNNRTVSSYSFDGVWYDIGTPDSYLEANHEMMEDETHVEDTQVAGNLEPGSYVMEDAVIQDSTLENTIVFPEAEIRDAKIKDSIVDAKAEVTDVELRKSVVGEHSKIKD